MSSDLVVGVLLNQ